MPHGQGDLTYSSSDLLFRIVEKPGPPREPRTRDGTSRNGRVLRRDASDRDWIVWRLVADVRRGRRTRLLLEFASGLIGNSSWL
ncbi:hypothetical protein DY000_02024478 [Brassica cretica]|uniref:Uncharacterized protein n=1 Tax=Brassica cretica TaxID=69181 RepID=A0ABQ7EHR3_BRACR|nr:hypothetical protein DY000_02024478 [Brassica cretica]